VGEAQAAPLVQNTLRHLRHHRRHIRVRTLITIIIRHQHSPAVLRAAAGGKVVIICEITLTLSITFEITVTLTLVGSSSYTSSSSGSVCTHHETIRIISPYATPPLTICVYITM
jgi:hypothetical protein